MPARAPPLVVSIVPVSLIPVPDTVPKKGLIKSVNYRNKSFLNNKNILTLKIFCENKKFIEKIDSHASRIGHVIVKSSNKKKGIILANKILKNVEIKYH